jgi:ketosteroid isomerase-like protein
MSASEPLELFIGACREALSHQVSGDTAPFAAVWSESDDDIIMGAVGTFDKGAALVREHLAETARGLGWLELQVETLVEFVSEDLAVTVDLEHMGKAPGEHRTLRSTQVYRREPDGWRLVHRHADTMS